MTPGEMFDALVNGDDMRVLMFHCTDDNPVANYELRLSNLFPEVVLQPQNIACPICGEVPGRDGFTYEVVLSKDVPPSCRTLLKPDATNGEWRLQ